MFCAHGLSYACILNLPQLLELPLGLVKTHFKTNHKQILPTRTMAQLAHNLMKEMRLGVCTSTQWRCHAAHFGAFPRYVPMVFYNILNTTSTFFRNTLGASFFQLCTYVLCTTWHKKTPQIKRKTPQILSKVVHRTPLCNGHTKLGVIAPNTIVLPLFILWSLRHPTICANIFCDAHLNVGWKTLNSTYMKCSQKKLRFIFSIYLFKNYKLEFWKLNYSIFLAVIYRNVHILASNIWILGWLGRQMSGQPKIQILVANICTVLYMTAKNIE